MEYVNCVVDELGIPMYRVSYLEQKGYLDDVLNNHPEWKVVCLPSMFYNFITRKAAIIL